MKSVVLVSRNATGSAFRYARYAPAGRLLGESTCVVELDPVPVGTTLPCLAPEDVELLRVDPSKVLG